MLLAPSAPHVQHFIDENHYRHKEYPLEPLFRSVQLCSPNFDFQQADIVTGRSHSLDRPETSPSDRPVVRKGFCWWFTNTGQRGLVSSCKRLL